MGGDQKTTSTQNQKQKSQQDSSSTSQTGPYAQAGSALNRILNKAGQTPQNNVGSFAPNVNSYAKNLLGAGKTGIGTLADTAGGSFLDQGNPYLQSILGTLNEQARTAVGGEFANAGRSVGGAYENALVKALTQSQAPYLFNNYQFERGNQQNAANILSQAGMQAPSLLNQSAALPFSGLTALSNLTLPIAQAFPTSQSQSEGNGININTGANTQTQASNPFQTAVGAGVGGLGLLGQTGAFGAGGWLGSLLPFAAASDRRLKEDIEQVGELFDGTPVYRFRYKGHPTTIIGLMADDVEQYTPEAVITNADGFKFVDYKLATERALTQ